MEQFLFVGDDLALDFINTRIRVRGRDQDLLGSPADLERWWGEATQRYPELEAASAPIDAAQLERLREFREVLREQMSVSIERGDFSSSLITGLNDVLARSHPQIVGTDDGDRVAIHANVPADRVAVGVALSAARLISEGDLERLHRCGGCILLFYDRTKSGTRHWCSTRCFDRARAQQRRAQVR